MQNILNQPSLFQTLEKLNMPILIYGMGNGADMVIDELEKHNLTFADTFASDNFVRGQLFHGKKVLNFEQAKQKYQNFAILSSFGVHDEQTLSFFRQLNQNYTIFAPTISVCGGKLFEKEFLEENFSKFVASYNLLADEKSKETFKNILYFKLTGKLDYLFGCFCPDDEIFQNIFPLNSHEDILDLGAYNGDTIFKFLEITDGKYDSITAFEPDKKNFEKLQKRTQHLPNLELYNVGAWHKAETMQFDSKNSRGSSAYSKPFGKQTSVSFNAVDNLVTTKVSFIKMDTEGAEKNAIIGAKKTIKKYHPKLLISAYHKNDDFFVLPLLIASIDPKYKIYLRQSPYVPAWETNLYCV